jgi:hypothetical protein
MSTFNRNTLALALAAALLPASAFAFNVQTAADTIAQPIAQQVASPITMSQQIQIFANSTQDNLQGRTTGFGVRLIILTPGVTIVGPFTTGPGVGLSNGAALAVNWTASATPTIGANVSGQSTASWAYSFAAGPGIQDGNIINIDALPLAITSPATSTSAIQARIELFDPNTNAVIVTAFSDLVSRPDGLVFACTAQANPDRIDVSGGTSPFAFGAKTAFVPNNAAIGAGPASLSTPLGTVSVTASAGFNLVAGDLVNSVITGTNLTNFTSFFLAAGPLCAAPIVGATYTITGNVAKLGGDTTPTSAAGAGVTNASLGFGPAGGSAFLCATVNGTGQIDAQSFAVVNGLNGTLENDPCTVASLQFNGSVVKVFTFNPAGNTTQESFLRVSNTGTTSGKVTVTGTDDNGAAQAAPVTFTLNAGKSFQFNSTDLEAGNVGKGLTGAFGDGAGKWRLVVTGEFDGMLVTSLNRNNTTGTLTNLTDADNRLEQVTDGK